MLGAFLSLVGSLAGLFAAALALLAIVPRLAPSLMGHVYDVLVVKMTKVWYKAVLSELPTGARLLDVGIGTGGALARNAATVLEKKITVVGVDYEPEYIRHAHGVMEEAGLGGGSEPTVQLRCNSIYDQGLRQTYSGAAAFDAVYFSGSITLMPDPAGALSAAAAMLRPGGRVYITQTYQHEYSPIMAVVKPWLRTLTTIDFGNLVYKTQMDTILASTGFRVLRDEPVPGSINTRHQTARLIVLSPQ